MVRARSRRSANGLHGEPVQRCCGGFRSGRQSRYSLRRFGSLVSPARRRPRRPSSGRRPDYTADCRRLDTMGSSRGGPEWRQSPRSRHGASLQRPSRNRGRSEQRQRQLLVFRQPGIGFPHGSMLPKIGDCRLRRRSFSGYRVLRLRHRQSDRLAQFQVRANLAPFPPPLSRRVPAFGMTTADLDLDGRMDWATLGGTTGNSLQLLIGRGSEMAPSLHCGRRRIYTRRRFLLRSWTRPTSLEIDARTCWCAKAVRIPEFSSIRPRIPQRYEQQIHFLNQRAARFLKVPTPFLSPQVPDCP